MHALFQQNTVEVAKNLLGKVLVYTTVKGDLSGIISETEAYTQDEPACHAYGGKKTTRTSVMFKTPGHIYIYFIYGRYYCLNIVTEPEGRGCAVLIRGLIPLAGVDTMQKNRGINILAANLTNGPGKLMMALGIPPSLNGHSIFDQRTPLTLQDQQIAVNYEQTNRIGLKKAIDTPWRFVLKANDSLVSYVIRTF